MPISTPWSRARTDSPQTSSRFSAWFHGNSIVGSERSRPFVHAPKAWRTRGRSESPNPFTGLGHCSRDRSPSSTRSIIDPTSSPNIGSEHIQPHALDRSSQSTLSPIAGTRYEQEEVVGVPGRVRTRTRLALSRPRRNRSSNKEGRQCFPGVKSPKVKRKIIGTLLSGIALGVILTTYLALAISNSVAGQTFHAILIMLILLITIIFCHYLVRLCMLTLRPKGHLDREADHILSQSQTGSIARPCQPIRVILARDEELGLHSDLAILVEEDKDIAVPPPPPPPAYGVWRYSVRADPNLIHWQRTEQPVIAEETLNSERRSITRPPSYRSQHRAEGAVPVEEPQLAVMRV